MLNDLRLYLHYISISIRGQMQYKLSFVMLTIAAFLGSGTELVALWVLFDRFKTLKGWTLPEAALLYGVVNMSFALAEGICSGFDRFAHTVKSGDFDRLLLRPRSTTFQVISTELRMTRIGKAGQALVALFWGAGRLDVVWTPAVLILLMAAVLAGACLFTGLLVIQATVCFWTIESIEIMNTMTYGGVETAQYPLSIYRPWLRFFFTFVVPLACVSYLPSLAILGRTGTSQIFYWLAPLVGFIFLAVTLQVWKVGVRHYCSTGS